MTNPGTPTPTSYNSSGPSKDSLTEGLASCQFKGSRSSDKESTEMPEYKAQTRLKATKGVYSASKKASGSIFSKPNKKRKRQIRLDSSLTVGARISSICCLEMKL